MSCNNSRNVQTYRNAPVVYRESGCGCGGPARQVVAAPAPRRENFTSGGCTLAAPAPIAACCNPAPLWCEGESCGAGYFRASDAYGQ